jgi:hypothetical protein
MQAYKFSLGQAVEYTIVELGLLDGDAISEALSFSALAKVALEYEHESDETKSLSDHLRRHCDETQATAAAAALESDDDRQAFTRDLADMRVALGIR